jgi:hypothetical protein
MRTAQAPGVSALVRKVESEVARTFDWREWMHRRPGPAGKPA